jgi:mitogen-activated protein kinase kinase kinase
MLRPSADELMNHPWMLEFREQLRSYEEAELQDPPAEMPAEEEYDGASVARQAAIIQEKEVEQIMESPNPSPVGTPDSTVDIAEEGGVL